MQPHIVKDTQNKLKTIDIYQATLSDISLICDWTLKLHQHEDDGTLNVNNNFDKNIKHWLTQEINNQNSLALIALSNTKPAGFILSSSVINDNGFLESPLKGVVHLLWIDPLFRQQNIAAKLLSEVETCLREIGVTYIECNYTANNQLAKSFWKKNNYFESSITAKKIFDD
jgi:ribosomal protein S18 acetylase RimI-like enzyme